MKSKVALSFFIVCSMASAISLAAAIGDVNNDGSITIVDALIVAQYYVGMTPAVFDAAAADADASGAVDIVDALLIAQYYVGIITTLPPGGTPSPMVTPVSTPTGPTPDTSAAFVRARGTSLVAGSGDTQLYLRGVAFGNEVWNHNNIPETHHSEIDFQRVKEMGMNTVRFYLNYHVFEDDAAPYSYKQSGWNWLDLNVSWAKKYGVYLVLNIHIPQGGFQSDGNGLALWNVPENQNRLTALWKAIAQRYEREPAVAGYDLLNEPVVSSGVEQWKSLAQRLADEIRSVDKNHLLVVEQLAGVAGNWSAASDPGYSQFLINDAYKNVMYDFHFYEPMDYTYQNAPWTTYGEAGAYPDETKLVPPGDAAYANGIYTNPTIPAGTSNWAYFEGVKYKVTDPGYIIAKPITIVKQVGGGTVYFDDFTIVEYNEAGQQVRTVCTHDIEPASGIGLWSETGAGRSGIDGTAWHKGTSALYVTGTTGNATCYFNSLYFEPRLNYSYSVSGWARGVDIPAAASCSFSIEFDKSPSGQPVLRRNKALLESVIKGRMQFGVTNQVPVNVGEFGMYRDCFLNGRNGIQWVKDTLDILCLYRLNFTYHCYHQYPMGIYYNDAGLPDPNQANLEVIALFTDTLSVK